jgi:hypothetical protein
MSIIFQQFKNEICLTVWGAICQRISDWEYQQDKMAFEEQLATGSFRGRFRIDDDLIQIMQQVKSEGKMLPYYGVGGSRGSCVYRIRRGGKGYCVQVENTTIKDSTEFCDEPRDVMMDGFGARWQTWVAVHLHIGQVAKPRLIFKIDGSELQNLYKWKHWVERQASTSRYIYEFGQVGMGRLGYTVKVEDTQTGNTIDATDYKDW